MPIDTASEAWKGGDKTESIGSIIDELILMDNPDKAYSVKEVTDIVLHEFPEVVPRPLRKNENRQELFVLIYMSLEDLTRNNFATVRYIQDEDGGGDLYYSTFDVDRK